VRFEQGKNRKGGSVRKPPISDSHRSTCLPAVVLPCAAAARSTVCFWTGFIDVQSSAFKVGAIQSRDCPIAFSVVAHFNESKTSGLSRITVGHYADTINGAMYCEHGSNRIFGSAKAEVSYKNILHLYSLSGVSSNESGQDRTKAVGPNYRKMPKTSDC
jgi:hypothetical protein